MDMITIYEGIILLAGIIGVYIKLQNEVSKLKNSVYTLEKSKSEVTDMLRKLSEDIQEIKILLARKQIDQ